MNSYYTICITICMNWYKNHTVYEFVLYNLHNNFMNWYKNHTVYEFVLSLYRGNEFAILRVFESQKSPFTSKIAG
jgi:hypothetical protein